MSRLSLLACLACLAACVGYADADPITFVVTNHNQFGALDLGTGHFWQIGDAYPSGYDGLGNLADGTLVAVDAANNLFVQIDPPTATVTPLGSTGINVTTSASLLSGSQYAVDDQNSLYQIDPGTGAATLVGPTGLPVIDPNTFANALAGNGNSLYYIFQQSGNSPVDSTLYQLDLKTGAATMIGPTGVRSLVGGGFVKGVFYAYSSSGSHSIFTIDLTTGAATDTGVTYPTSFSIYGSNSGTPAP